MEVLQGTRRQGWHSSCRHVYAAEHAIHNPGRDTAHQHLQECAAMMVWCGDTRVGLKDACGDQRHTGWVTLCWKGPRVTQAQAHMCACLRGSQAATKSHHHQHTSSAHSLPTRRRCMPPRGVQLDFKLVSHTCTAAYIGCCKRCTTKPHRSHRHACVLSQQCVVCEPAVAPGFAMKQHRRLHTLQATT